MTALPPRSQVSPAYKGPTPGSLPLWHTTSLLRDVRYDARYQLLTAEPIDEYIHLRTATLASLGRTSLGPAAPALPLGKGGRQLDVEVEFERGDGSAHLGVTVLASPDGVNRTHIYVSRMRAASGGAAELWSLTVNTSGSTFVPGRTSRFPVASKTFPLGKDEQTLRLRVLLDRSIVEAFAQGGRAVVTATVYAPAANFGAAVSAEGGDATLLNASAWAMGCAWEERSVGTNRSTV